MRTIVITGAGGKIGETFVRHFIHHGDRVLAITRSKTAQDFGIAAEQIGERLVCIGLDLLNEVSTDLLLNSLDDLGWSPTVLINNARDFGNVTDCCPQITRKQFLDEFELGVVVPYELAYRLASSFMDSFTNVVNIGSIYGIVSPNLGLYESNDSAVPIHYGVSKAALIHLTKEMAVRLAKDSIRVNAVAYGGVEGRVDQEFLRRYSGLCPMQRMLVESDLAGPVELILSQNVAAMTGQTLVVDGGWTLW